MALRPQCGVWWKTRHEADNPYDAGPYLRTRHIAEVVSSGWYRMALPYAFVTDHVSLVRE